MTDTHPTMGFDEWAAEALRAPCLPFNVMVVGHRSHDDIVGIPRIDGDDGLTCASHGIADQKKLFSLVAGCLIDG